MEKGTYEQLRGRKEMTNIDILPNYEALKRKLNIKKKMEKNET